MLQQRMLARKTDRLKHACNELLVCVRTEQLHRFRTLGLRARLFGLLNCGYIDSLSMIPKEV
jgi:hypothetical protein